MNDIESEIANLRLQIASVNDKLVQSQLDDIEFTENRPTVVTLPRLLPEPVAPLPKKRAFFGALAGTLVASAVGYVILRRSVR